MFFLCYLVGLAETLCRWLKTTSLMHFLFILKVKLYHAVCSSSWCTVTILYHANQNQFTISSCYIVTSSIWSICIQLLPLPFFFFFLMQFEITWVSDCPLLIVFKQCPSSWGPGIETKFMSFCGMVPLAVIDKVDFVPGFNLATSSSALYATLHSVSTGMQWSVF